MRSAKTIPTLKTSRLVLRAFTRADAEPLFELLSGPDVLRYFPNPVAMTRERTMEMIERLSAHWHDHGYGLWAVVSRTNGALMGRCGLQYLPDTDEVEVDFLLGREFWNRGFATEAAGAALRYGRDTLQLSRVVGIVHPGNLPSRRVLEKSGLRFAEAARYFGMDCLRYVIEWPVSGGNA